MSPRHLLAAAALVFTTGAVFAQAASAPASKTDAREAEQQARIKAGKESGELTKPEAHRLQAEQRAIKHQEKKAAKDGVVTDAEQAKIDHMQNKANRDIRRQKHDKQQRAASAPAQ